MRRRRRDVTFFAEPSLESIKPFSPIFLDVEPKRENAYGLAPAARPRVPSNTRRTALGWSKRSTGGKSSTDQKENVVGQGVVKMCVPSFPCFLFHSTVTDNLNAFDRPGETDLDRVDVLFLARNNVHLVPSVFEVSNDPCTWRVEIMIYALSTLWLLQSYHHPSCSICNVLTMTCKR